MTDIVWQVNVGLVSFVMCYIACLLTNERLGEPTNVRKRLLESAVVYVVIVSAASVIVWLMKVMQ